jgi:putative addiction module component (TIGR02574 family)
MTAPQRDLLDRAMKLPPAARAALAGSLLESLDSRIDPDVEAAWAREIAKRLKEIDSGKVRPIPSREARRRIAGGDDRSAS